MVAMPHAPIKVVRVWWVSQDCFLFGNDGVKTCHAGFHFYPEYKTIWEYKRLYCSCAFTHRLYIPSVESCQASCIHDRSCFAELYPQYSTTTGSLQYIRIDSKTPYSSRAMIVVFCVAMTVSASEYIRHVGVKQKACWIQYYYNTITTSTVLLNHLLLLYKYKYNWLVYRVSKQNTG